LSLHVKNVELSRLNVFFFQKFELSRLNPFCFLKFRVEPAQLVVFQQSSSAGSTRNLIGRPEIVQNLLLAFFYAFLVEPAQLGFSTFGSSRDQRPTPYIPTGALYSTKKTYNFQAQTHCSQPLCVYRDFLQSTCTQWRRCIGCLNLQVSFHKRAL